MYKTYKVIEKFKFLVWLSVAVLVLGIVFSFVRGIDLSIDFKGGSRVAYSYTGKVDFKKIKDQTEKSLATVGSKTEIMYSYTGDIDNSTIESAMSQFTLDGFTFGTSGTTMYDYSIIKVTAVGNNVLSQEQIDKISAHMVKTFATNNINYFDKEESVSGSMKVEISESEDFTTGQTSFVINVIGNNSLSTPQVQKIEEDLVNLYPDNQITQREVNSVSASFGQEFFAKSLYAVLLACILVVIYVGYRFRKVGGLKAGIASLAALIHDLVLIFCVDVIFGITIDLNFIAVFLTILGYSLNDTIVIFDRLRENTLIYEDTKPVRELMNMSISQSLKRTTVTSVTTFVAITCVTVVAAIRGLDSILTFSIPMSVGCVFGTFSSLFISGPIYVFWKERDAKKGKKRSKTNYANKLNPKKAKKRSY